MAKSKSIRPAKVRARIQMDVQRQRLFKALGVIAVSRAALATKLEGIDEQYVIDALQVAGNMVEDVAAALGANNTRGEHA